MSQDRVSHEGSTKCLQDLTADGVKSRFVAQQVAYENVTMSLPPLAVAGTLLAVPAIRNMKEAKYTGLLDITPDPGELYVAQQPKNGFGLSAAPCF